MATRAEKEAAARKNSGYNIGGFQMPPAFSYDPAILAELRALERGFKDTRQDHRIGMRQAKQDLRTQLRDIALDLKRGRRQIRTEKRRALRDIGYQRQDVRTTARRGREDLTMQLDELVRQFGQLGSQQFEAATAAGVTGGGTMGASAAARQSNFSFARRPLDIQRQRISEDLERDLERLRGVRGDVMQDSRRGLRDLRQDVRHDRRLARRDFRRFRRQSNIGLQRANREMQIGRLDLTQQAIFQARQNQPGAFSKYGRRS